MTRSEVLKVLNENRGPYHFTTNHEAGTLTCMYITSLPSEKLVFTGSCFCEMPPTDNDYIKSIHATSTAVSDFVTRYCDLKQS